MAALGGPETAYADGAGAIDRDDGAHAPRHVDRRRDVGDQAQPDRRAHPRPAPGPAHQLSRSGLGRRPGRTVRAGLVRAAAPRKVESGRAPIRRHEAVGDQPAVADGYQAVAVAAHVVEPDLGEHGEVAGDGGLASATGTRSGCWSRCAGRSAASGRPPRPAACAHPAPARRRRTAEALHDGGAAQIGARRGSRACRPRRTPRRIPRAGSGRRRGCTAPACPGTTPARPAPTVP